jgi:hypothetical protein
MAERKVLHSWKEISSYMTLGVRTIQRYELHLGLPIHRVAGKRRSAVVAFSDELDVWVSRSPTRNTNTASNAPESLKQIEARRRFLEIAARAKGSAERAKAAYAISVKHFSDVQHILERAKSIQDHYRRKPDQLFAKAAQQ